MATKLEQAARQALEALEQNTYYNFDDDIKALREALSEQAEQELVSMFEWQNGNPVGLRKAAPVRTKDPCNPLQDLTDDEIYEIMYRKRWDSMNEAARAVIAADREKNRG